MENKNKKILEFIKNTYKYKTLYSDENRYMERLIDLVKDILENEK